MILNGKCKEDFEKWLSEKFNNEFLEGNNRRFEFYTAKWFDNFTPSMQYGMLEDFFDGVRIYLEITRHMISESFYFIYTDTNTGFKIISNSGRSNGYNTRPEARTKAIEKANECYNER